MSQYTRFKSFFVVATLVVGAGAFTTPLYAQTSESDVSGPRKTKAPTKTPKRPTMSGPPWLGVMLSPSDGTSGVGVDSVMNRGPAAAADLRPGDRIIGVAGQPVNTQEQLKLYIRGHRAGDSVKITYMRGEEKRTATLELEAMPSHQQIVKRQLLGRKAPDFEMKTIAPGDSKRDLRSFEGKPTIVEFWATWCAPCRKVSADLERLEKKYGDRVNIVGVSGEKSQTIEAFARKHSASYPLAVDLDRKGHDAFFITSFPTVILLDEDQNVAAVLLGASAGARIEAKLQSLLEEDD